MFKTMTGANLVHVPFKGNAEVLNALLGGHVKVHFALTASTLQHVRSGALRVLAVTTEKRLPDLPDVPTIAELGYPGYEISSWQGVFAPAGTPKDIIGRLNGEIVAMLNTPEVQARITREGALPVGSSPEQWSERFKNEVEKWAKSGQERRARRPRTESRALGSIAMLRIFATRRCLRCCPRPRGAGRRSRIIRNRAIHIVVPSRPAARPMSPRDARQRDERGLGPAGDRGQPPGGNTVIGAQVAKAAPTATRC